MPRGNNDDAVFGRESLFRKKLNELRVGHPSKMTSLEALNRQTEIHKHSYLEQVQSSLITSKENQEDVDRLNMLDGITDLYNSKMIMGILKDELKRAKRYKYPVSVLLVTVDGFDEIDGRHGHFAANSVLKGLANVVMGAIRDVDIPARYDANTLMILCPHSDLAGATVVAERLLYKISIERVSDVGQNWVVTASIGVSGFPGCAPKEAEIVKTAFDALYLSQQAGGGSYTVLPVNPTSGSGDSKPQS